MPEEPHEEILRALEPVFGVRITRAPRFAKESGERRDSLALGSRKR